ncbi:cation:proton antiporter [Roseiconus nitratireducens]|nr:sodium:proton antiporter [Roseiconus nitratireducens]
MNLFSITSVIVALAAVFGFINVRFLKLPKTIGLMLVAIAFTMLVHASAWFNDRILDYAQALIGSIDFQEVLLDIMLGFLLFAGALNTNFDQLRVQRWPILTFSTLGVLASTMLVGTGAYFAFNALGLNVQFIHCLLFGALISPTDPIAVLGILRTAGVPKALETKIVGESLFNDGVGVVVFLTVFGIASSGSYSTTVHDPGMTTSEAVAESFSDPGAETLENTSPPPEMHGESSFAGIAELFLVEVGGGIVLGIVLGTLVFLMMRSIDDYEIEIMISLACVMGGYSLAAALHVSGPLAIVVAGLIVGSDAARGRSMSAQTEKYLDHFWEMVDMLMNAILFVLIGLEILILHVEPGYLYASLVAIALVLAARFLSLLVPVWLFSKRLNFVPHSLTMMTWGGLRGGISIALALQLTEDMNRDLFLTVTYGVVVFSIVVQGLSVGPLARRLIGQPKAPDTGAAQH